jgi:hypothetical protein
MISALMLLSFIILMILLKTSFFESKEKENITTINIDEFKKEVREAVVKQLYFQYLFDVKSKTKNLEPLLYELEKELRELELKNEKLEKLIDKL